MLLSKDAIQMMVDLIENRISAMQVSDREDMREMRCLQQALHQLQNAGGTVHAGLVHHGMGDLAAKRGRKLKATYLS